jgi:hypothetical protein
MIICQRVESNFVIFYCVKRRIRILMQKKINIRTGCGTSECLMTSIILSIRNWALSLYLSFLPAYRIKHILSKDFIFFLVSNV